MKILWINPSFLDYRIPLYYEIFKRTQGGFSIIFSKNRVPERVEHKIKDVLKDHAISLEGEKRFHVGANEEFANKGITIPWPTGLVKEIHKTEPDIIICEGFFQWSPWGIYEGIKRKIPILISYERTRHTERNCPSWRTVYRKIVNHWITGYLINGTETKLYLEQLGIRKPFIDKVMCADSIFLSSQCSQVPEEQKKQLREKFKCFNGLIYLCAGQLIERKGVEYLLNAWKKHICKYPSDRLLILGDGVLREYLQNISKGTPSIHFLGAVNYDQISQYYAIADIFILPTLEDNWSLVIPEAMACSLPVATSIYNGCHTDLIQNGKNGYVFDPYDNLSIIQTLEKFHFCDLKKMGQFSVQIEREYSPQKAASRIVSFCERIIYEKIN